MKRIFTAILTSLTLVMIMSFSPLWGNMVEASSVPDDYIVWDRMPAEAPVQMGLKVTENVDLYDSPQGTAKTGQLEAGESVMRISVAVFTHPSSHPVQVLKMTQTRKSQNSQKPDGPVLYPGNVVYLLMYTGEGTYLGWYDGQLLWWLSGQISDFSNGKIRAPWAQYIGQVTNAKLGVDTWYCLRKSDGEIGWVQVQFEGQWKEPFKVVYQE